MNPWTLAALGALGIVLFATHEKSGSTTQSVDDTSLVTDAEIAAVADYAIAHETDANVLRDLARFMRVLPMGTPQDATAWNRRRTALEAKAAGLNPQLATSKVDTSATMTFAQMRKLGGY